MINASHAPASPYELLADEDLVARIAGGEPALFELLMRRHNQRVYRAVRAVLGSEEEVEDVMQQAYLNAYSHLDQFAGEARFTTWLTRIAVNEALARRRRGAFTVQGDDDMTMRIPSGTPDPEQQAAAAELRDVMEREIEALPAAFRTVFILREVEGLSTAETAGTLNISEDLVKTRLHRARAALRENLFRTAGVTLGTLYEFGNARCDRVVAAVMARIR